MIDVENIITGIKLRVETKSSKEARSPYGHFEIQSPNDGIMLHYLS